MPQKCPDCKGTGYRTVWIDKVECELCEGLGIIPTLDPQPYYRRVTEMQEDQIQTDNSNL